MDIESRNEILELSNCYYKGYQIDFVGWKPNFNENDSKHKHEIKWMECVNIPPELNKNHILKRIGQSLGTLIGFESNKHK